MSRNIQWTDMSGDMAYLRKCLDLLDTELTRKSNRETPVMSAEGLLCPVLNAKATLDRIEYSWRQARSIIGELADVVHAECEGEKYHVTLLADADSIVSSDPQSTVHNGDCVPQTERNAAREALTMVKKLFDGRIMWQPDIRKAHEAVNAALAALEGGANGKAK